MAKTEIFKGLFQCQECGWLSMVAGEQHTYEDCLSIIRERLAAAKRLTEELGGSPTVDGHAFLWLYAQAVKAKILPA